MALCPLPKREELAACSYDKIGFQFMVRKTYFFGDTSTTFYATIRIPFKMANIQPHILSKLET